MEKIENSRRRQGGFTLIELLIVMAILGVLAAVVLVLINPSDKLAQANDTGRISTVNQLGRAVAGYNVGSNNTYPDASDWANILIAAGNPSTFPAGIKYMGATGVTACTTNVNPATDPTYCYDLDTVGTNGAIVFAKLEAKGKLSLCTAPEVPYFVYSTADSRAGTICSQNDPAPWAADSQAYVE